MRRRNFRQPSFVPARKAFSSVYTASPTDLTGWAGAPWPTASRDGYADSSGVTVMQPTKKRYKAPTIATNDMICDSSSDFLTLLSNYMIIRTNKRWYMCWFTPNFVAASSHLRKWRPKPGAWAIVPMGHYGGRDLVEWITMYPRIKLLPTTWHVWYVQRKLVVFFTRDTLFRFLFIYL